jgi:long-chain acyl-CoA synthetase
VIGNPPSLAAFFDVWRRNSGEFLRFEGDRGLVRTSYAETAQQACAFAERLRAAGIGRGERVVLWGENRPEWIVALWGCLLEGVIAVPVDYRSSVAVVANIAQITAARALLIGPGLAPPVSLACPLWPLTEVLTGEKAGVRPFEPAPPDQVAEILFTSGATGEPRGVTITHRNILANLKPIDREIGKYRKYMRPFSPIRFLNLLPLSHMFGQSMSALIPPMIAGEVYFQPGYSPREAAHLIQHRRISVMVCVPQMLELLREYIVAAFPEAAETPRAKKWYARWWQYRRVHRHFGWKFWAFVVGAAALDPALEEFWGKLGYVVIQGYGLTETAPVATLNHPFHANKGTVGKPIGGVEIRIATDGEVLLRGENVTPGYYGESSQPIRDPEGWLHTGDIGELSANGHLKILGRKKEMIVSPDGLNVYPDDVERALNTQPGVRDCAVVAARDGAREQVHAVLLLEPGVSAEATVAAANGQLESHQKIRGFSVWPGETLPRTSGTNKLKRGEVAKWVAGAPVSTRAAEGDSVEDLIGRFAGRAVAPGASLDELGLSSLDRIQLLMELEQRTGGRVDETAFAAARTVADLAHLPATAAAAEPFEFPVWSRSPAARVVRRIALPLVLPLVRVFAWLRVEGRENLRDLKGPVIFASNHQSHFDVPAIFSAMPGRWRYQTSPAMAKEFFDAHFHPERHGRMKWFTNTLNYVLACLVFNAFPLPQREAGTREALRYAGELTADGNSILIFPEGKRTNAGELLPFMPGTAMLASRLNLTVVPVCLAGLEKVLHKDARFPTPGRASVRFGKPIRMAGDNYTQLAKALQEAVAELQS